MSNFEVINRRGENKPEDIVPVAVEKPKAKSGKRSWEDVQYGVAIAQGPGGQLILLGRVVGLRDDDEIFIADWVMPPIVGKEEHFQEHARKRLDTFLDCDCTSHHRCSIHDIYLQQWPRQDTERINLLASRPVPKALERMQMAERATQKPNLAIPRG